jgi:hypothetical protein
MGPMAAKPAETKPGADQSGTGQHSADQPISLTGHVVPAERLALILPHMAALSQMALTVSDQLPLGADVGDFVATLNADARHRDGV